MMFNRISHRKPRLPQGRRVYAIGDVHGEAELLSRLLLNIASDSEVRGPAETTLVMLGDFIDRGPGAAELLRSLYKIDDANLIILKGNHEAVLVKAYDGDEEVLTDWIRYGGAATLVGLGVHWSILKAGDTGAILAALRARLSPDVIDWLDALPLYWSLGDYFFVHAGVRPGVRLLKQRDDDLLWIRDPFLTETHRYEKVIVHGHTIEPGVPELGGHRIGLDTGAHERGQLTTLGLEGDRQWLLHVYSQPIMQLTESESLDA